MAESWPPSRVRSVGTGAVRRAHGSSGLRVIDAEFLRLVGAATYARGRSLAFSGAVHVQSSGPGELVAAVRGSRPRPYRTRVSYQLDLQQRVRSFTGECTCPVGLDCKHAVAVLISHLAAGEDEHGEQPEGAEVDSWWADGGGWTEDDPSPWSDLDDEGPGAEAALTRSLLSSLTERRWGTGRRDPSTRPSSRADAAEADSAPQWERSLRGLLALPAPVRSAEQPLALLVDITLSSGSATRGRTGGAAGAGGIARVAIRPAHRGAHGRWIRTGVAWHDLLATGAALRYRPEQVCALRELAELAAPRHVSGWFDLTDRGGRLWSLLDGAVLAGIELVTAHGLRPVQVSSTPAELWTEITRDREPTGGDLTVTTGLALGGERLPATRFRWFGEPVAGVLTWPADSGPDGRLVLAPVAGAVPTALASLATAAELTVPAADAERFLDDYLPRLRRVATVASSDGSVELPAPDRPRVRVTLDRRPAPGGRPRVTVRWDWRDPVRGEWRALDGGSAGRPADLATVQGLITALVVDELIPPELRDAAAGSTGTATVRPVTELTGLAAATFLHQHWPRLRDDERITAVEQGNGPDYRPAIGPVEIDLADPGDAAGTDWFDLDLAVVVDDEPVPFESIFLALACGDDVVVTPGGTFFPLEPDRWGPLRRLIEEARGLYDLTGPQVRLAGDGGSRWAELVASGLLSRQALRWQRQLGGLSAADRPAPVELDELGVDFRATLRSYQQVGVRWLREREEAGVGGILADDMGLGKTVQTLAMIAAARHRDPAAGPFLVVAPTSVVGNWVAEAATFTPGLQVRVIEAGRRRRGRPLSTAVAGADIVVTSYALFRLDKVEYRDLSWSGLVLDEAQFAKNRSSQAYDCAVRLPARVKFAVTGTPLENNLAELWALLSITVPGLFPDPNAFDEYFRQPGERGDVERLAQLRRRIAPFLLRRTKEEAAPDLPPKQEQVLHLELTPAHRKIYDRQLQRERQKVLGLLAADESGADVGSRGRHRIEILASLTRMRQLSLDPALVEGAIPPGTRVPPRSAKLDRLVEHVTEVAEGGHRTLVFSQFTGFLDRAQAELEQAGIECCRLDGSTRDRAAVIQRFRSGTAPVFLISLKAGGFGLNLVEADYCILLDPWWNPAAENQAVDRAHRIGQRRTVVVYRYVSADTVEDKVMALKAGKAALFDAVLGAAGATADEPSAGRGDPRLSAADIRQLLS